MHENAFSPRLGIAWAPTADLVLRASYDRVFQTPAVENLLLASSPDVDEINPESARLPVEPSHGHFFEAGITTALGGVARLDVTAYRRTFINFADDDVFLNTGRQLSGGVRGSRHQRAGCQADAADVAANQRRSSAMRC